MGCIENLVINKLVPSFYVGSDRKCNYFRLIYQKYVSVCEFLCDGPLIWVSFYVMVPLIWVSLYLCDGPPDLGEFYVMVALIWVSFYVMVSLI